MFSMVDENIHMLPVIKAFVREKHEHRRFEDKNQALLTISGKQAKIGAVLGPAITFLASAGLLLLLWLGISHVESGVLETGQLVSLLLYAMLLTQPISGLANVYGQVQRTRGAAERLQDFFAEQREPVNRTGPRVKPGVTESRHSGRAQRDPESIFSTTTSPDLPSLRGDIKFDAIGFAYPGREPLFEDFGLRIAAGETLAITGPNGAGKSTLAWLLMRFAEPDAGRILIDGQDISEFSLQSLRNQIGLVAQNTLLVNGTVRDNLAYGNTGASEEEIKKAANAARANEFIEQLPQGYDTVIGDQGIKLSGGQRQRLSLARTLMKNPPILILDEATSMFDPEGETGFIRKCREVLASRTVILIGHRPTSLALANRVINLERRDSGPAFVNRSVGAD
jgi:ABC-type multidrug transport system fused ATPase/permease subunit